MSSTIQRIRLVRPESGGFGFYIRGGAEHGLGIYISQVEMGSEAHVKGLKKGDQILKVCGLYVDKATHKEIFSLIKEKTSLELKVRSEGVLPVKQTKSAPVSWKSVKEDGLESSDEIDEGIRMDEPHNKVDDPGGGLHSGHSHHDPGGGLHSGHSHHDPGGGLHSGESHQDINSYAQIQDRNSYEQERSSYDQDYDQDRRSRDPARSRMVKMGVGKPGPSPSGTIDSDGEYTEVKISLELKEQQGLGCSICKGPPEKPGIYIQSTKAGKLAREVGLQTGDQIVHCNGIDFLNIPFGDAVFHLKANKQLNLTIWKGTGASLFPNESSGYESSSGSSTGTAKPRGKRTIKTSFPVPRAPPPPQSSSSSPSSSSSGGHSSPRTTNSPATMSRDSPAAMPRGSPAAMSRGMSSPRHGKRPPSQLSNCPASPASQLSRGPGSPPIQLSRIQASQLSRGPASPVLQMSRAQASQLSRSQASTASHLSRSQGSPASQLSRGPGSPGSQLFYQQGSPVSYMASPATVVERDLHRERQKLKSEKEKLRREQQALQVERNRLEQEKILFRNTIQRTQSEERPTKTVQTAVRDIERSSSVHSTARETLLVESIVNRRRNSASKRGDLDSDTNISEYSENSSKESFDDGDVTGDDRGSSGSGSSTNGSGNSSNRSGSSSSGSGTSGGGLASALQSEIKRRAEKNSVVGTATKGILKKSDSGSMKKSSTLPIVERVNKHDLLIAEFKQAHMRKYQQDENKASTPTTHSPTTTETPEPEQSQSKPKAPPPPPPMKTSSLASPSPIKNSSVLYSSMTPSVSSEASEANRSLSTFRPDSSNSRIRSDSDESESTEKQCDSEQAGHLPSSREVGHLPSTPIFIPGIPTPDYDATPDRSPSATGKLYIRNRNIGKRVSPPTIEGITRAKSLSSLVTASDDHKSDSEMRSRGKHSNNPGLLSSGSMKDISKTSDSSPLQSINSSLRSYEAPSLNLSYSSHSSFNIAGKEYSDNGSLASGSVLQFSRRQLNTEGVSTESPTSGNVSQFSRRQVMEGVSMESFQLDMPKLLDHKPPPTYFDSMKTTPLSLTSGSSFGGEKESFQFQTKPCHPSQIPVKEEGEEAKLASQDYRAVNAQPRPRPYCLDIKSLQREFQEDKQPSIKAKGVRYPGIYKEDKNRQFPKFSGLKKPAPPPPILRKI